jgi:outer membrane biosynthesis protein TonB
MLVVQVFIFRDGQFLGNEMATGERIEVGRDPACEVHLEDESVSRKHCFLFEHDGRLAVQDAGSALGTKVNGEAASTPRYVGGRDDVAIGRYTLKFKQMSASGPSVAAPGPSVGELPPTAHVDQLGEPTSISSPGQPSPSVGAPLGGGIQFPAGLAPTGEDEPTRIDPDPGIMGDLDSALDAAFPEAGKPTAVLDGPDPVALGVGPTMPDAGALSPSSSGPMPLAAEAPFVAPGPTAARPMPGAQPGSVPSSEEQPATMLAQADTRLRVDAMALREQAEQLHPEMLAPAPAPMTPPSVPGGAPAMGSMPGTGEADELAAMVGLSDDTGATAPHSDVVAMAAPDVDVPSVEWAPGGGIDDEDDEDDPIPEWSIVEALVSAQDAPSEAKDDNTLVEVIHYRNDRILDHAELAEGERFDFGRVWNKEGLQDAGVGKTRPLVKHKRGGVAELIIGADVSGMLLREGQQIDLRSLPEAQGKGKVPLTLGDLASLELYGDRVFIRIGKAPAVKPTAEMIAADKRQRKLTMTAFGIAIGIWLMIFALAWIAQYRALAETVVQLEDEGFAEVIEPELELEEPEPEPEEPKMVEEEAPKPEQKEAPKPDPEPQAKPDAPKKPGVLDALKNVPKQRAGNQSLSAAMSNIKGVRVPGASGFKVSSVVGKGPKGVSIGGPSGGVSSTSLNSILRKGGGTGNMASKKGRAVQGRVKTLKRMSQVKGQGQLSKEEIMKVINKHIGKIQYCYEKQLRLQPGLSGKVQLEWVIGTDGKVKSVKSTGSTLQNAAAINCMSRQVKDWRFPKPRGSGTVIVKFPFVFNTL